MTIALQHVEVDGEEAEKCEVLADRDLLVRDDENDHDEHGDGEGGEVACGAPPEDGKADVRQTEEDHRRNDEGVRDTGAHHRTHTEVACRVEVGEEVHGQVRKAAEDGEKGGLALVRVQAEREADVTRERIDVVHPEHTPAENEVREEDEVQQHRTVTKLVIVEHVGHAEGVRLLVLHAEETTTCTRGLLRGGR